MSLLMEALRRAETDRHAGESAGDEPSASTEMELMPEEEPPEAECVPPPPDPSADATIEMLMEMAADEDAGSSPGDNELPAPPSVGSSAAVVDDRTVAGAEPVYKSVLARRRRAGQAGKYFLGLLSFAMTGAAIAGYYYWRLSHYTPPAATAVAPAPAATVSPLPPAAENTPFESPPAASSPVQMIPEREPAVREPAPPVISARDDSSAVVPAKDRVVEQAVKSLPATVEPTTSHVVEQPMAVPAAPITPPPKASGSEMRIVRGRPFRTVNPKLVSAYNAYRHNELSRAGTLYRELYGEQPRNRDVLLGLAAIAVTEGRTGEARRWYARILELNPADPDGRAGLLQLEPAGGGRAAESDIKQLLESNEAPHFYFALGNLYAGQQRWPEARHAYLNAWRREPRNADYAFNLAISLEHLGESARALKYYRIAAAAAGRRLAVINEETIRQRIEVLSDVVGETL